MLGDARDFVERMWLILQQYRPGNYVLATGETHSVREFLEKAFAHIGGQSLGTEPASRRRASTRRGETLVEVDPRYFRPTEMDFLFGHPSKARAKLGWRQRTSFETLVW